MSLKVNAKQIKNFAFQPVGPGPHRHERLDHRMLGGNAGAQRDASGARDGNQLIVQFKARFEGKAIEAGDITQKVEIEGRIVSTLQGDGPQQVVWNDEGGLAVILDDLRDRLRVPQAKLFDYNISFCIGKLRLVTHVAEVLEGLALLLLSVPVERALLPEIDITDQENGYIYHHFYEAKPPRLNVAS